jgi:hypothetical protein
MHALSVWLSRRSCLDSEGAARTSKPETEEQGPSPGDSRQSNKSPPPGPRRLMFATLLAVPQQTAQVVAHDSRETSETAELQVLIAPCGVASALEAYCGEGDGWTLGGTTCQVYILPAPRASSPHSGTMAPSFGGFGFSGLLRTMQAHDRCESAVFRHRAARCRSRNACDADAPDLFRSCTPHRSMQARLAPARCLST